MVQVGQEIMVTHEENRRDQLVLLRRPLLIVDVTSSRTSDERTVGVQRRDTQASAFAARIRVPTFFTTFGFFR